MSNEEKDVKRKYGRQAKTEIILKNIQNAMKTWLWTFLFILHMVKKWVKKKLSFGDQVKKNAFHTFKYIIDIDKVDIKKIVTYNKISYCKKGLNT